MIPSKKKRGLIFKTQRLAQIDINILKKMGLRGVILDLDNTIVSEDDTYLSPDAETWIISLKREGIKFFILSNGKRKHRVAYWSSRLEISAISSARKPFPLSFRKALLEMGLKPWQTVVIGDSCHTDVLGAWLTGCFSIQVASLPHPPRWWEKILGRWVQEKYINIHELCLFDPNQL